MYNCIYGKKSNRDRKKKNISFKKDPKTACNKTRDVGKKSQQKAEITPYPTKSSTGFGRICLKNTGI